MTDSKRSINDKSFRAIYLVSCLLAIFLISTVGILAKTLITKGPTVAAHTDHSIDGVCGTTHMTCINDPKHGKCGSPTPSQNCDYPNFMVNFISNGAATWTGVRGPTVHVFANFHDPCSAISGLIPGRTSRMRWLIYGGPNCSSFHSETLMIVAHAPPCRAQPDRD